MREWSAVDPADDEIQELESVETMGNYDSKYFPEPDRDHCPCDACVNGDGH